MSISAVRERGCYVKEKDIYLKSVREVIRITDDDRVGYKDYDLEDGRYRGPSTCSVATLRRWADREASEEEVARLRRDEALGVGSEQLKLIRDAILLAVSDSPTFERQVLELVSDDFLLAEVRRRDLSIDHEQRQLHNV